MPPVRIAILGATSYIAKGLIAHWTQRHGHHELFLYARSPEQTHCFLKQLGMARAHVFSIEMFGSHQYDTIINCVGIGSPQKLNEQMSAIFRITTSFDELVLDYLGKKPETLYINFSSGAAYGTDFSQPVDEQSKAQFPLNDLKPETFYGIAKLHSEARHRALPKLNIVDLRIFGYFSRYVDLHDTFLLSELVNCLQTKQIFFTNKVNIVRDFTHPDDLVALIESCMQQRQLNDVFDVRSRQPVTKFELLDSFTSRFGLHYEVTASFAPLLVTGTKNCYYSASNKTDKIGFKPEFTSLEGVIAETEAILAGP